jgi:hypothetical protein
VIREKRFSNQTEAEVEGRIASALGGALPFLRGASIRHQFRFTLRLGHNEIEIDGRAVDKAIGRLDLIVLHDDRPLAVLEIKRPSLELSDDDRSQGLSYARLIDPMAPLLVVSNGSNTHIYRTIDGSKWAPTNAAEETVESIFSNSGLIAAEGVQESIAALLGPASSVVRQILNGLSKATIDELTGQWGERHQPFARHLLFPRKATRWIAYQFGRGRRWAIVSGAPLSGKSNVLRELFEHGKNDSGSVFLLIEGASARHGLFQTLADAFSRTLNWKISPDDARHWLFTVAKAAPFQLTIGIDDCDPEIMGGELDGLASNTFGHRVNFVLTCDIGAVSSFLESKTGRQRTRIGRLAEVTELELLDDEEFVEASSTFNRARMEFMHGAERSDEYRNPWILRTMAEDFAADPTYANEQRFAAIPSLPGLQLIRFAQERFQGKLEIHSCYSAFVDSMLEDIATRDATMSIARLSGFVCRRDTLLRHLSQQELSSAMSRGELKPVLLRGSIRAVTAQIPEFAAAMLAHRLGFLLAERIAGGVAIAVTELVKVCESTTLGDVIGAFAVMDAAISRGGLTTDVIEELLDRPPVATHFNPGARMHVVMPEGMGMDMEVAPDGVPVVIAPDGSRHRLEPDPDDADSPVLKSITPWIILSYFAAMPLVAVDDMQRIVGRLDPAVLAELAKCMHVLRLPSVHRDNGIQIHQIPGHGSIVCHQEGIVEPVTLALMNATLSDRSVGEFFVEEAVRSRSTPMLARLHVVFGVITNLDPDDRRKWARRLLDEQIKPSFNLTPIAH